MKYLNMCTTLIMSALFAFAAISCGDSADGNSTGDNSNNATANNGTANNGKDVSPVSLDSVKDGEAMFRFSGAFNDTMRFNARFSTGGGWGTFTEQGQEDVETQRSSVSHRTEQDAYFAVVLHAIEIGENEYAELNTGMYDLVVPGTPVSKLRQFGTFAELELEEFAENSPITWDEVDGDLQIIEVNTDPQSPKLVGTVSATLTEEETTVHILGAFKADGNAQ